jgi:molybdate transport system regulatory protein
MAMARAKLSIVFRSGARMGPGKAALLESIRDSGSISAAARGMGMSYKRAWLLIDSLNQCFTKPVVISATGGRRGGGARLTPFGIDLLNRYRRMEADAASSFEEDLRALERFAAPSAGPKV